MSEVEATRRKAMTKARRQRILAKTNGLCAVEGCREIAAEIDHRLPLWMGGADEDHNMDGLCVTHHKAKTKKDANARAKAKRLLAARLGLAAPPRKRIRSRGFPKGVKRPIPHRADPWERG